MDTPATHSFIAGLAGTDAYRIFHGNDEDFAISDVAGSRRFADGADRRFSETVADDDLHLQFRCEIDLILGAAIHLLVTLLAAKSLYLTNGHADDTETAEGLLYLVENPGTDDAFEQFHTLFFRLISDRLGCVARLTMVCNVEARHFFIAGDT